MAPVITSEIVVAYSQCPRKAYLLLFSPDKGEPHEYIQILEQQQCANQERYLNRLQQTHADLQPYSLEASGHRSYPNDGHEHRWKVGECSRGRGHRFLLTVSPLVLFTRNTRRASWRHYPGQTPRFFRPSLPARIAPVRGVVSVHSSRF